MEVDLAEALVNGEREEKIKAAIDLSELNSKQKKMLVNIDGIIDCLVSLLYSQDYESIEASVLALISLSSGSDRNKIRITKAGSIPVLIQLLMDEILVELVIVILLTLSSCKPNKMVIAECGIIPILLEILNGEDNNNGYNHTFQTSLDAINILHNLSTCQELIIPIISSGTISYVLQLIYKSDKSSPIVEKSVGLLETIASSSEIGVTQIGDNEGGILTLVEIIEECSVSRQIKEHAVEILHLICKSCREKYTDLILREGAIPGLLQLCVDGTKRAKNTAHDLLLLLRPKNSTKNYGSKGKKMRNWVLERVMRRIDSDEVEIDQNTIKLVEDMIINSRV